MIDTTPITIQSGANTLRGLLQVPAGGTETKPIAILNHGLTAHHMHPLLEAIARALLANDIIVLRVDFNGHGISDGRMVDMTISKEVGDAEAVLAYAQSLPHHGPIVEVGHSQGGVVALSLAARHIGELDALVLVAPGVNIIEDNKRGRFVVKTFDPSNIPATIEFDGLLFGGEYLRDSPAHDPFENVASYTGPLLIVQGDRDLGIPLELVYRLRDCANGAEVQVLEGANHDFAGREAEVGACVAAFVAGALT